MHRQYVEYMRGVDVTDQLRGNYSSQLRCYKWWMKIFNLIVDQTMVNSYVTWVKEMEQLGLCIPSHLAFKIAVGKHMLADAIEARSRHKEVRGPAPRRPVRTQTHFRSKLKRKCVICGQVQKWFCPACRNKWMCREECYQAHHKSLMQNRWFPLTCVHCRDCCCRKGPWSRGGLPQTSTTTWL